MGIQNSNRAGNGSAIELDKILLSLVQVTELHVKDFPPPFCLGNPVLLGYRFVVAVGVTSSVTTVIRNEANAGVEREHK